MAVVRSQSSDGHQHALRAESERAERQCARADVGEDYKAWPGVWSGTVLHQVAPDNMRRLKAQGRVFGLAECGAACVPASPVRGPARAYCPVCWLNQKVVQEAQLPSLPKRVPGFVPPRQSARSNPSSPWFTTHDVA